MIKTKSPTSPKPPKIIAIDGPAGSGKSTLAKGLAHHYGFVYIDTGAMYRSLALLALEQRVSLDDVPSLVHLGRGLKFKFNLDSGGLNHVWVNGREVTHLIRSPEVALATSKIATHAEVREILVQNQKQLSLLQPGVVMEGRDITTVVTPHAQVKFFVTAESKTRAQRRALEQQSLGMKVDVEAAHQDQIKRDAQDSGRQASPLKQVADAYLIDTTHDSKDQVLDKMIKIVDETLEKQNQSQNPNKA
jgi:cytidylate kinase